MTPRDPFPGAAMMELVAELHPICRSITGDGVRRTLAILARDLPLAVREVPSGTPVLDWTVPDEWNIRDAWIKDSSGRRVVDFNESNLHVVSYSVPVSGRFPLDELRPRLHALPEHPDRIPYRTSYYHRDWGFCLTQRCLDRMHEPAYEVGIESTLGPGHLTMGELVLPGRTDDEILVSTHVCHPSLCNDNLSGIAVAAFLARALAGRERRHTVRFLFMPGTIGAITWLALNRDGLHRIRHGMTLACLGADAPLTWKRTLDGADIDRVAAHVLANGGASHEIHDYLPYGFDERQFNSPGFRLAVGSLTRGRFDRFDETHTSADDLGFISGERLASAGRAALDIIAALDANRVYRNLSPFGEPQLGRRGLYRTTGGAPLARDQELSMLWVLALSDGDHALIDIAERSGLPIETLADAARRLEEAGVLG